MLRRLGFTFIEVIVVILILAILAVIAIPRFINVTNDARIAQLQGMKAALVSATKLVHAKAQIQGFEESTENLEVDGQAIQINHGYPTAQWTRSVRFLVNLNNQSYTPVFNVCNKDWCGRGNQTALPSGITTSTGLIAKIFPRGYQWSDNCDVYYLNHQDGTPPIIEIETEDCD